MLSDCLCWAHDPLCDHFKGRFLGPCLTDAAALASRRRQDNGADPNRSILKPASHSSSTKFTALPILLVLPLLRFL